MKSLLQSVILMNRSFQCGIRRFEHFQCEIRQASAVPNHCTRTYKNFGHQRQNVPLITNVWHWLVVLSIVGAVINWQ